MNDIDALMARVDEINHRDPPYTDDDIATIILYHRTQRARRAAGEKPIRATVDVSNILGNLLNASKPKIAGVFKGKL